MSRVRVPSPALFIPLEAHLFGQLMKSRTHSFRQYFTLALAISIFHLIGSVSARANEKSEILIGSWSAPSLGAPEIRFYFTLLPDGNALAKIRDYEGKGTWNQEGGSAKIQWAGGWTGILQPTETGGFELLTWKKAGPEGSPPDDTQPATKLANTSPDEVPKDQ